jgi:AcrR family transcriptional regulator
MTETQDKILDTAERLFGEQGYAATSLRQIIAEAGVNLAAIHYHFGSKEDLLDRLIFRKASPVNEERLDILDRLEAEAGSGPVTLDEILRAFLGPPFQRMDDSPGFLKLMGRMYGEGLMPSLAEKHFHTVKTRFSTAFGRALPNLTPEELALRIQFMVGAMAHCMFAVPQAHKPCSIPRNDSGKLLRELVAFLSGGLRAPAPALVESLEEK